MSNELTAETKLEDVVVQWLRKEAEERDGDVQSVAADLARDGCVSGIVDTLVYYEDTVLFYGTHKAEINRMLAELLSCAGESCPAALFAEKWDSEDPLALDQQNQNLLAWFGFEEAARRVCNRAGIEL